MSRSIPGVRSRISVCRPRVRVLVFLRWLGNHDRWQSVYLAMQGIEGWEIQLRKGSLELAILASLAEGKLYGLEILRRLEERGALSVPEGTIYPLLARLKDDGWVDAEWVAADLSHPRKYYRLTAAGRRRAVQMARAWSSFSAGLHRLLEPLREGSRR